MKNTKIYMALPLLTLFCACQSEMPQTIIKQDSPLMVKASFPTSDNTRTQISYGNTDREKEIFSWTAEDEILLYNMTRFQDYPDEACFDIQPDFGKNAEFKFDNGVSGHAKEFEIKSGDTLLALYGGETNRVKYKDADGNILPDERNIVLLTVGTQANKPQPVFENPDDVDMSYMQGNMRMYDILTVVEDDKIPDIHFKHLSAILRVSLRNETGNDIYPTQLKFDYPDTESFFNSSLYCNVDTESPDNRILKVFEDNDKEFFKNSIVYADTISTTINYKEGTLDAGASIKPGQTYDLYISTVPRIGNDRKGNKLTISLVQNHKTDNPYSITIDGFDAIIEAGKRYWFNLTAVEDEDGNRKLMLTNKWLADHPGAEPYYK